MKASSGSLPRAGRAEGIALAAAADEHDRAADDAAGDDPAGAAQARRARHETLR